MLAHSLQIINEKSIFRSKSAGLASPCDESAPGSKTPEKPCSRGLSGLYRAGKSRRSLLSLGGFYFTARPAGPRRIVLTSACRQTTHRGLPQDA
jgi:hypothetical protein